MHEWIAVAHEGQPIRHWTGGRQSDYFTRRPSGDLVGASGKDPSQALRRASLARKSLVSDV